MTHERALRVCKQRPTQAANISTFLQHMTMLTKLAKFHDPFSDMSLSMNDKCAQMRCANHDRLCCGNVVGFLLLKTPDVRMQPK